MTQTLNINDLLLHLEGIASVGLAEAWDNVGLMVGDRSSEVTGILVALDPTEEVLDEAIEAGLTTIITHHPLIFHPLKMVATDQPLGRFLQKALAHRVAVIGCHTNLDQVVGGVNDVLATALGLQKSVPLTVKGDSVEPVGFGRLGCFPEPVARQDFLKRLGAVLDLPVLMVAGRVPDQIERVAVCGGSGSDLAETAFAQGAQVYVTAEVKHSTARWAEAGGFCIIDGGHFATENPVVPVLADHLDRVLTDHGVDLEIRVTRGQKPPFLFYRADGDRLSR